MPHARWTLVGLLFLATLLNYLDRQTISVSATTIANEMGLTDGDLGQLFFAFLLAYGLTQMFLGAVLDRMPVRVAYALAVASWSLAGAAAALATDFWMLLVFRILLGICESPNWPLAMRVVSRTFPPEQRALANGLYQCGTSIGALVAPPLIVFLTVQFNWRVAFVAVGAVGAVWVVLWFLWFRLQAHMRLDGSDSDFADVTTSARLASALPASPTSLAEILHSRAFWGLLVATSFLNPLNYFYLTWLPRYFEKYAGVGFGDELAKRLVLIYLTLDVAYVTGGALVAWLSRFVAVATARRIVAAVGALCMATVPAVAFLADVNAITAIIGLATFGLGWTMVNYLAFTTEVSMTKVSTAAGILGGAGALSGAGFMLLVGNIVERSGNFAIAFVMVGTMPLVALAGIWYASISRVTAKTQRAQSVKEDKPVIRIDP